MSLRQKFVLALLLTSLLAVALVGGVAYLRLNSKFDSLRREQASLHFRSAVTAYLERYGSWQAGASQESFGQFMASRRPAPGPEGMRPPPPPEGGDDRPPPPDGPEGGPPRRDEPPFRFILMDGQYRILLGAGDYQHGELAPPALRRDAMPVQVRGVTMAYVSPQGVLSAGRQDKEYLAAMREALAYGAIAATALALLLGLWLGTRLSSSLQRLTVAVQAMRGGTLHQQVPVQGRDEVATLATAFNQMSAELAQSHTALQQSHETILEQANQLKEMSIRDALTELHNRRHFDEQAQWLYEQSQRHGHPLTVVIGDIDFFKRINDSYSHAVGDAVLRQIGAILRTHVRITDLVARYGGEEFVIALPETPLPQAAALCDKLRQAIEQFPWHNLHPELKVTMSMGLCGDLAAGTVQTMLQQADGLLYRAKEMGRNRVCFA